jgi:glyoxylase-like metal-dependent hydrolase (beta-lactamase superfamily II)
LGGKKGAIQMGTEQIVPNVYRIGMGYVSAYLIAADDVTVIDSGLPKRRDRIFAAVREAEHQPEDVKHIALTHHHVDHTGSLAALLAATTAITYIHPLDAPVVRGEKTAPGPNKTIIAGRVLGPVMDRLSPKLEIVSTLHETNDGDQLPAAGGMIAVHTPGHTAGHLSYLWPQSGGVLFAGDAAGSILGLGPPTSALGGMFTEDIPAAKDSFRKLAELEFDVACFGHGGPIKEKAHATFRRAVEKLAR